MQPVGYMRSVGVNINASARVCVGFRLGVGLGLVSLGLLGASAREVLEDFASDPAGRGWRVEGDAELFRWDATRGLLEVTWDSSRPNSYFALPLGTVLGKDDAFSFSFELVLQDLAVGTTPGMPYTFEIALGLLHRAEATQTNFLRGTGFNSPNLVEWDYFPDSGFGATVSPTIISAQHQYATSFNTPFELTPGARYHCTLAYTPADRTLTTTMTREGQPFGPLQPVKLAAAFDDFRVDTFAVASYSDAGQDPMFSGSIRAHGAVDNLRLVLPAPPVASLSGRFAGDGWQAEFRGRTGWEYTLEASDDTQTWTGVAGPAAGTGLDQTLVDARPLRARAFYRIRADKL